MPLVPMRILLDHAAEHGYGLAAFNVNNMEQIQSIMEAAKETDSPVIVQASRGARSYSQDNYLRHLMIAAAELYPSIPIAMHQDHGNSPATCQSAIDNGFTSVMMDGSLKEDGKSPADFDYNVKVTADVVKLAHRQGVSVEGELGCLGSLESGEGEAEDGHGATGKLSHDQLLTDPDEAARFVAATGVDALAVAIGTSHGAYKFTRKPDGDVLAMKRIEEIHAKLPNCHLVMHGSSSVPQELQDVITTFGGKMPQTWGVPVEASVAEIFRATSPALPIPVTTTLPVHSRIIRTPRQKSASSVSAARSTASPSTRRIRRPCARMSSLLRSSMRRSFRQAPRAPERGGGMVGRLGKPRNADFAPVAGAKSVRIAARAALLGQACSRNRGSVMVTAAAFTPRRIASPCRRA